MCSPYSSTDPIYFPISKLTSTFLITLSHYQNIPLYSFSIIKNIYHNKLFPDFHPICLLCNLSNLNLCFLNRILSMLYQNYRRAKQIFPLFNYLKLSLLLLNSTYHGNSYFKLYQYNLLKAIYFLFGGRKLS